MHRRDNRRRHDTGPAPDDPRNDDEKALARREWRSAPFLLDGLTAPG
jgi:hypothetical protein